MNIVNLKQCTEFIPKLAQWHQQEWSYLNPGQTLGERVLKMQGYLGDNFIPSTFVAIKNNTVLGSAAIVECDMEERKELSPWLASVFVTEGCRRQGIGSDLVKYVMQQALSHGYPALYLYTPDQQDFYRSFGWSVVETMEYHGTDVTIMSAIVEK